MAKIIIPLFFVTVLMINCYGAYRDFHLISVEVVHQDKIIIAKNIKVTELIGKQFSLNFNKKNGIEIKEKFGEEINIKEGISANLFHKILAKVLESVSKDSNFNGLYTINIELGLISEIVNDIEHQINEKVIKRTGKVKHKDKLVGNLISNLIIKSSVRTETCRELSKYGKKCKNYPVVFSEVAFIHDYIGKPWHSLENAPLGGIQNTQAFSISFEASK